MERALWVLVLVLMSARGGMAQTIADAVKVRDTRDIIDQPTDYNREVRFDFKKRSTVGVPGIHAYSGLMTIAPWADNSGGMHHQVNFNDGGVFYRTGRPSDTTWSSWRQFIIGDTAGNVGIGTDTPHERLSVNGKIRAQEIKVEVTNWPDYVFDDEYNLRSLSYLENFLQVNRHLPDVPSRSEVAKNGVNLGEMNARLLAKIEELTLYIIQQHKHLEQLQDTLHQKDIRYSELETRLRKLEVCFTEH